MKAVVIVLLGCLPLTFLTVRGLLKPDSDSDLVAADQMDQAFAIARAEVSKPPSAIPPSADEPIGDDLLSGGTVGSYPTEADRPRWVRAHQLLVGLLDADKPTDPTDIEASKQAKQQLQRLKADCTEPPLPGSEAMVAILDRRIGTLTDRIGTRERQVKSEADRRQLTEEAKRLLAEARAAFKGKKYAECLVLCDRLIEIQSQGIETVDLTKLQEVKKLAAARDRFVREDARLSMLLKSQKGLKENQLRDNLAELTKALDRWQADNDITLLAAEQRVRRKELAEKIGRRCGQIEAKLGSTRQTMTLAELERNPGKDFFGRLRRAEKVLDQYPTEDVKRQLRALVERWIGQSLPTKKTDEPDWLYATLTSNSSTKKLKPKPTEVDEEGKGVKWEDYERKGTLYSLSQLDGPPAKSPARRCVDDYAEARKQLLANPQDKALWSRFATLCEDLQRRWDTAQDEFGSTEELSFKAESRFARQVLDDEAWGKIEKLLGKGKGKTAE